MIQANQNMGGPKRLVDKACQSVEFYTPEKILERVRAYFGELGYKSGIELDPATHPSNPTRARLFYTEKEDGLKQVWTVPGAPAHVFVNPPYGEVIRAWVDKIAEEADRGARIVALLPGQRFEQRYWQRALFRPRLTALVAVTSRVRFLSELCMKCSKCAFSAEHVESLAAKEGKTPHPFETSGVFHPGDGGNPYGSFLYCYNGTFFAAASAFRPIGMVLECGRVEHHEPEAPLLR